MDDPRPIRRCVCMDIEFAAIWESNPKTLEEIAERFGCGAQCGLCRPYLVRMLETGETAFAVMEA